MAAGLELEKLAEVIQNDQMGIIRIMPNTPVAIGQGVISLARSQAVTDQQVALSRSRGSLRDRGKINGSCNGCRRLRASLCLSDD